MKIFRMKSFLPCSSIYRVLIDRKQFLLTSWRQSFDYLSCWPLQGQRNLLLKGQAAARPATVSTFVTSCCEFVTEVSCTNSGRGTRGKMKTSRARDKNRSSETSSMPTDSTRYVESKPTSEINRTMPVAF